MASDEQHKSIEKQMLDQSRGDRPLFFRPRRFSANRISMMPHREGSRTDGVLAGYLPRHLLAGTAGAELEEVSPSV